MIVPEDARLTPRGIDLGDDHGTIVDDYLSYGIAVEYENDEVIIFADESLRDIREWSEIIDTSWDDLSQVFHDVSDHFIDDAHLVFSAVDPIVFAKPGEDDG